MSFIIPFALGAAAASSAAAVLFIRAKNRRRPKDAEAAERLRRSENFAFAGRLAGGLIHEVKNPLNTLSLNLQLLAEEWRNAETPEERRALKRINRLKSETDRLTAILDEFMGFVRGHRLSLAERDVNTLVEEVVMFVRPELEVKRIEIRTSYGELPHCRLDVNLIKQALLNLILNAQQASEGAANPEIIVRTAPEEDSIRIDVIDTGKGIPAEDVERVFEAFYSTRRGGTGLGLPMTRRIVEEHGGHLAVHSDPGRGTCFSIILPSAQVSGPDATVEGKRFNGERNERGIPQD